MVPINTIYKVFNIKNIAIIYAVDYVQQRPFGKGESTKVKN